jgi:hypothetical protein
MTQGWRGGVDTSKLAVRALACAFLLLAVGAVSPKRKGAARLSPGTALQTQLARDAWEPLRPQCMVPAGAAQTVRD